jgi:hypothetical protein
MAARPQTSRTQTPCRPAPQMLRADGFARVALLLDPATCYGYLLPLLPLPLPLAHQQKPGKINLNKSNYCSSKIVRLTSYVDVREARPAMRDVWVYGITGTTACRWGCGTVQRSDIASRNGFLASSISAPGMASHPPIHGCVRCCITPSTASKLRVRSTLPPPLASARMRGARGKIDVLWYHVIRRMTSENDENSGS